MVLKKNMKQRKKKTRNKGASVLSLALAKGIHVVSWDTRGLLGSLSTSQRVRSHRLTRIRSLTAKADMLRLQETIESAAVFTVRPKRAINGR